MLKYTIRKGPSLNFTEGMSWDEELKDFEYMARTALSEDPDTYGCNLGAAELDDDELEEIIADMVKETEVAEEEEEGEEGEEEEEEEEEEEAEGLYAESSDN